MIRIAAALGSAASGAFALIALGAIICAPDTTLYDRSSRTVSDSEGNLLHYTISPDGDYRFKTAPGDVDPIYIKMLLASEDKRFYSHAGVDPIAIFRAAASNLQALGRVSGASTLAMQCARRLSGNERTLLSKAREALGAIYLTATRGREGVLAMHLTLAPFGGNTDGVRAASLRWFGHGPEHLSPAEAALLVALPRAPQRIRPDRHPERARRYRADVLRLALENGVISKDVCEAALAAPLPKAMRPVVRSAAGLGTYVLAHTARDDVRLSARPQVLRVLKEAGRVYSGNYGDGSVMAAVVVDAKGSAVTGLLGSSDERISQLCLPMRLRSPGSALKPFVYAIASERLGIKPGSVLDDAPAVYGGFAPRNSSGTSLGPVTAAQALSLSLNRPAVELLERTGPSYFLSRMNSGRERIFLPKGADPSLALALGGCSATLLDLALMYDSLSQGGMIALPELEAGHQAVRSRFLSGEAAGDVRSMLRLTPAPYGYAKLGSVFYKTGTSSNSRDALAIGGDGSVTVAVWCGRPDGRPVAGMTGMDRAAPMLFRILSSLNPSLSVGSPAGAATPAPPPALADGRGSQSPYPSISFPREGDLIAPDSSGRVRVIYACPKGPCHLSVNEHAVDGDEFAPAGDGPVTITITDGAGHSRSVNATIAK
ncbi:MAG: transglycosylase domain-containing protein [Succinivibrio sp.]